MEDGFWTGSFSALATNPVFYQQAHLATGIAQANQNHEADDQADQDSDHADGTEVEGSIFSGDDPHAGCGR